MQAVMPGLGNGCINAGQAFFHAGIQIIEIPIKQEDVRLVEKNVFGCSFCCFFKKKASLRQFTQRKTDRKLIKVLHNLFRYQRFPSGLISICFDVDKRTLRQLFQ